MMISGNGDLTFVALLVAFACAIYIRTVLGVPGLIGAVIFSWVFSAWEADSRPPLDGKTHHAMPEKNR